MAELSKIREVIEPMIQNEDLILYDLRFTATDGMRTLQVMICDKEYGMDMDTCEKVSDLISTALDASDLLADSYLLDVCSPGAERELRDEKEIESAVGKYVHIELKNPKEGIDTLEGYLKENTPDSVTLEYRVKTRKKEFTAAKDNLRKIRLAVEI